MVDDDKVDVDRLRVSNKGENDFENTFDSMIEDYFDMQEPSRTPRLTLLSDVTTNDG